MATASVGPEEKNCFETQISEVRIIIETRFRELTECLREREKKLLKDLEEILNTFKKERDKQQVISKLQEVLKFTQSALESESGNIQGTIINKILSEEDIHI